MVELYSGLSVPVILKGETSKDIATAIENNLIKPFGVPLEISCDNAANLGGSEVRKLLDFYGIKLRRTVPYSPQSHAIVENSNKYLVILIRIFSEQFKVPWTSVLTLAALICNSVPRYQLKGHSPYYMIFLREPLTDENMVPINIEEELDVEDRIKKLHNGRNYLRLINEYLLASRDIQNKKIGKKYISYPVGTMILVKDNRPKAHRKLFPVYFKCPEKVIFEYTSVIYTKDWLGRVRKHSKNNVKKAGTRTIRMFNDLPPDIKALLGDVFNEDNWEQVFVNKEIPQYFLDIPPDVEVGPVLRNQLPKDSHLIEQELPKGVDIEQVEEEDIDFDGEIVIQLNNLHSHEKLTSPNIKLHDIPSLHKKLQDEILESELNETLDTVPLNKERENIAVETPENEIVDYTKNKIDINSQETGPLNADILISNILPKGSKRVRFAFPKFQMPNFFRK
jgi:hypothetical protein